MKSLVPCPNCHRHVRAAESACPFCRSALPNDLAASAIPAAPGRMRRAAIFAFTATLGLAGCSDNPAPTSDSGTVTDTGGATDAGVPSDDGSTMALYGGPPVDVPAPTDLGPQDDGGPMPLYGAPADVPEPTDTAMTDTGGGGVRYGAPPPPDADYWV
jgi:hypothetical protein